MIHRWFTQLHSSGKAHRRTSLTPYLLAPSLSLCLFSCSPLAAFAQTTSATLLGNVTDPSGAVVSGATVTIKDLATGTVRTTQTDGAGIYSAPQLIAGGYSITVTKSGFTTTTRTGVYLQINQSASVNITLAVGSVGETVQVSGSAPLLQTEDVSLGTVVETKQVNDLPLNGRQFSQLLELAPGVVPVSVGQTLAPTIGGGIVAPGVNGQTNRANLTFIDGVLTTDNLFSSFSVSPSIDAIQSFQVQSHAVDAEYGESTGGTFNIATKAGSNQIHGDAYEFFRNQSLNAIPYFLTSNKDFSLNDFGGTLGGPVLKNKLFLFGYYEGVRQTEAASTFSILPTPAELSGDFSALLPNTVLYDPATYDAATKTTKPFAGNQIDPSRFNQGILQVLQAYVPAVASGAPANASNYQNSANSTTTQNQWGIRADYNLDAKDLVFGRYIMSTTSSVSPEALAGNSFVSDYNDKNLALNYIRAESNTLTAQITAGLNLFDYPLFYQQANAQSLFNSAGFGAGFTSTPGGIGAPYLPGIHASGDFDIDSGWGGRGQNQQSLYQISGSVIKLAGRHNLKLGVSFYRSAEVGNYSEDDEYFNQQATWNPCASLSNGACVGSGGNSIASLLLGLPVSASRQLGSSLNSVRNFVIGAYAQDSWKLSPKLTLNYGLRWDVTTPPVESQNRFAGFDIHNDSWVIARGNRATPSVLPTGVSILPTNQLTGSDYKNVSPRFGVNYLATPKIAILAGAGVFFDNWAGIIQGAQNSRGAWPNGANQSVNNTNVAGITADSSAQNPFGTLQPLLPATPFPSSGTFLDSNFKDEYSWQWNLQSTAAVKQRRCPFDRLCRFLDQPGSRSPGRQTPPSFSGPRSTYLFRRCRSSVRSKARAISSTTRCRPSMSDATAPGFRLPAPLPGRIPSTSAALICSSTAIFRMPTISTTEEADSSIDIPIVFTGSAVYELPFGKGKPFLNNGIVSVLLGHWQANTLVIARQGTPFTPTINIDNANANGGTQRPNVIGDPSTGPHTLSRFFNTAAYAVAAPYSFGSAGRNSLRGPRYTNADVSVFRSFPVFHEERLELRAEAFNFLNHPQFSNPDGTLEDANFGQIKSTTGNPREIQLAAKYTF